MAVRKIELAAVESNLRNVSSSAETMRRLQEEMEAMVREYNRERGRYRTGEIARDVFRNLKRDHERRVGAINRKIASLIVTSTNSLNRTMSLVADHMPAKKKARARRTRRKAARRRRKTARRTRRKRARRRTTRRRVRRRKR